PLPGHYRKLAAAGGDNAPLGGAAVAPVDLRLPAVQRVRADLGPCSPDRPLASVAVLLGGEGRPAGRGVGHHGGSHDDHGVRLLRHDRKLAAAGGYHAPLGEDDVSQVDLRLPAVQRFRADLGLGEHALQLGAVAVLQGGEGQLAGIADEHHAASHADDGVRLLTDAQEGRPLRKSGELFRSLRIVLLGLHCPLLTNLRQRVSPGNFYWISLTALVKDALALLTAHAHLLGNFIIAGGWILSSHPTRLLHRRYTPVSGSPTQINPSMARQTGPGPPLAEPRYAPAG